MAAVPRNLEHQISPLNARVGSTGSVVPLDRHQEGDEENPWNTCSCMQATIQGRTSPRPRQILGRWEGFAITPGIAASLLNCTRWSTLLPRHILTKKVPKNASPFLCLVSTLAALQNQMLPSLRMPKVFLTQIFGCLVDLLPPVQSLEVQVSQLGK